MLRSPRFLGRHPRWGWTRWLAMARTGPTEIKLLRSSMLDRLLRLTMFVCTRTHTQPQMKNCKHCTHKGRHDSGRCLRGGGHNGRGSGGRRYKLSTLASGRPVMHPQAKILSMPPHLRTFVPRVSPMYQPPQQQEGAAVQLPGMVTACS